MSWTATIAASVMMFMVGCCTPRSHEGRMEECVSKCGMLFQGIDNGGMSCDQLQRAEDTMLEAYNNSQACKDDPRFCEPLSCKELFGWQINTEDAEAWTTGDGQGLRIGSSDCTSKVMEIGNADTWKRGSFPHEIAHVIQNCRPPDGWVSTMEEDAERGDGHDGWSSHGVDDVINAIRGKQ